MHSIFLLEVSRGFDQVVNALQTSFPRRSLSSGFVVSSLMYHFVLWQVKHFCFMDWHFRRAWKVGVVLLPLGAVPDPPHKTNLFFPPPSFWDLLLSNRVRQECGFMVTQFTKFWSFGAFTIGWLQRVFCCCSLCTPVFIIGYLLLNPDLTYIQWSGLFEANHGCGFLVDACFYPLVFILGWLVVNFYDLYKKATWSFVSSFNPLCGLTMFVYVDMGVVQVFLGAYK